MIQLSLLNTEPTFSYIYLILQLYVSQALHIQHTLYLLSYFLYQLFVFFFSV